MQNAELRRLTVRGLRRHSEPLLVVRQYLGVTQVELGRVAETRKRVRLAVGGTDQEFAGVQPPGILRRAVRDPDVGLALDLADSEYQSRARFRSRPGYSLFGKAAVNDVAWLGQREEGQRPALEQAFRSLETPLRNQLVDRLELLFGERPVVRFVPRQRLAREIRERDVDHLRFGQTERLCQLRGGPARHAVRGVLVAIAQQDASRGGRLAAGCGALCGHGELRGLEIS